MYFMKWILGTTRKTSQSVLLNVPHHNKHVYSWLRGDDRNSFQDSKPFIK